MKTCNGNIWLNFLIRSQNVMGHRIWCNTRLKTGTLQLHGQGPRHLGLFMHYKILRFLQPCGTRPYTCLPNKTWSSSH